MKNIHSIFLSLFVISLTFISLPTTLATNGSNGYNDPIIKSELNFTATMNANNDVEMTWTKYAPNGFNYYKVVRSTDNPNPVYPEDSYIKYSSDPDFTAYTDTEFANKTTYYRVCSIVKPDRYCSNVVIIDASGQTTSSSSSSTDSTTLNLTALSYEGKLQLSWEVTGEITHGFKLAKSTTNKNPTYPVMDGDTYKYISDSNVRSYVDGDVTPDKIYNYRICKYNGNGVCLSYSNSISVKIVNSSNSSSDSNTNSEFKDTKNHTYVNAIEYVKRNKIVNGYEDGTFKPDASINREEFTKIIINARYKADTINACTRDILNGDIFPDVKRTSVFADYICTARVNGIINGYENGTFGPKNLISFKEAAKIIVKTLDVKSYSTDGEWWKEYISALQDKKYIPQTVSSKDHNLTRGEMAELIWRVKEDRIDQPTKEILVANTTYGFGDYAGWDVFSKGNMNFSYPRDWFHGIKRGWDYFSEEKDYIDNLLTPYYMNVDTYMVYYTTTGSGSDDQALNVKSWFAHPEIESQRMNLNGVPTLRKKFRAPRGSEVNGRTTTENEIIVQYTYRDGDTIHVLYFFNARGIEDYLISTFDQIGQSFKKE